MLQLSAPRKVSGITSQSSTAESLVLTWSEPQSGYTAFEVTLNNQVIRNCTFEENRCTVSGLEEHARYDVAVRTLVSYDVSCPGGIASEYSRAADLLWTGMSICCSNHAVLHCFDLVGF